MMQSKAQSGSLIVYLHIPKTGGMSLDEVIGHNYDRDAIYEMYESLSIELPKLAALPRERLEQIRMVKGHIHYGLHEYFHRPARYFTMLRDPVQRVISLYYYARQTPDHYLYSAIRRQRMSVIDLLDAGLTVELDNGQTRDLASARLIPLGECTAAVLVQAQENVERYFDVVGLTERFDETLVLLARTYGWTNLVYEEPANVTANHPGRKALDPALRRRIEEANALDCELYRWAAERFARQVRSPAFRVQFSAEQAKRHVARRLPPSFSGRGERVVRGAAQPRAPGLVHTRGALHDAFLRGGHLSILGWAGIPDGVTEGFRVICGREELTDIRTTLGVPSPLAAKVLAQLGLKYPERASFIITAKLSEAQQAASMHALVQVIPFAEGREGRTLVIPMRHAPVLPPPPSEADAEMRPNAARTGAELVGCAIQRGGLRPETAVLDLVSGAGLLARYLAYYLESRYEGVDPRPEVVERAQQTISTQFPNFTFRVVDLQNEWYRPGGTSESQSFKLPYPDATFGFVFAPEVFTHVRPSVARQILREIRRVLQPGARCLLRCYLVGDQWREAVLGGSTSLPLAQSVEGCYTVNRELPEALVALEESDLLEYARDGGLSLVSRDDGAWCGRPLKACFRYDDVLIFERPSQSRNG